MTALDAKAYKARNLKFNYKQTKKGLKKIRKFPESTLTIKKISFSFSLSCKLLQYTAEDQQSHAHHKSQKGKDKKEQAFGNEPIVVITKIQHEMHVKLVLGSYQLCCSDSP